MSFKDNAQEFQCSCISSKRMVTVKVAVAAVVAAVVAVTAAVAFSLVLSTTTSGAEKEIFENLGQLGLSRCHRLLRRMFFAIE